jgi:hypothetical protein
MNLMGLLYAHDINLKENKKFHKLYLRYSPVSYQTNKNGTEVNAGKIGGKDPLQI